MEIPNVYKRNLYLALLAFLVVLSLYFTVGFLSELKSYGVDENQTANTIVLSGHGEVSAVPDIANIYFTIDQQSKTVAEAQTLVAQIEKKSLDFLESNNVLEKDIQTTNASFNPQYEYQYVSNIPIPCAAINCPPVPGKNVITGYEASESITVKIRNIDDVGKIMQGLGTLGVSNLNGPNFSIDNQDTLQAEARKEAIDDAKAKAVVLANDLGVHLGKITSFNESGNNTIVPMYATAMASGSVSAPAAVIPQGQNTITSDITITYEIE